MTAPGASKAYKPLPQTEFTLDDEPDAEKAASVPESKSPSVSWFAIYCLCVANLGISCSWALEFALTTPYFSEGLQAGEVVSHGVWIVGPLSGLIVAPIVGALSDRCTSRWGRRRPFILAGMLATLTGMALFPNARELAALMYGTAEENAESRRIASIVIAIFAFSLMDLAINTTMWPVRALQGDLVPSYQQHSMQSASNVVGAAGDLAANFLVNSFEQPVLKIKVCFLIVGVVYAVTVSTLLFLGKETPVTSDSQAVKNAQTQPSNILEYLRGLPPWMWRLGTSYAFAFFMLFCTMPNASSWMGSSVLSGNPTAPEGSKGRLAYEKGVKLSGKAGLVRAFLQILLSGAYPSMLKYVTPGHLMSIAFGIFSVCLAFLAQTRSVLVGEFVLVMMALPMAATFALPTGVTVENSDDSNRGRYLGALNCFAVIPQLIDTTYTGYVSRAFGEVTVIRIGAAWGLITSIHAYFYMRVD